MQLCRNGKKWTRFLCRFKFGNRREERDSSRAFRRQSYSRVKEGRMRGICFAVLYLQNSYNTTKYLHVLETLWDDCIWFALTCTVWIWKWELFWSSLAVWASVSVVVFVCSQIVAPVLNYEKQQPGGTVNFHKTITASWIQVLDQMERGRERERDREKKEWRISRAPTNRRCDSVRATVLLLRWYQFLLLSECDFYVTVFRCIIQTNVHKLVSCIFL